MKVISVNTGKRRTLKWGNKMVSTGIFKYPSEKIQLGTTDVEGDEVVDREYHGGTDKACYLYSADHYGYWKKIYPDLEWDYGMLGENVTIKGLNEADLHVGDIFQLGDAVIQISEPRQPCFKLNIRFNSHKMVKQFIDFERCGAYVRVLQEGMVKPGDPFVLTGRSPENITVLELYQLMYKKTDRKELIHQIIESPLHTEVVKDELRRVYDLK